MFVPDSQLKTQKGCPHRADGGIDVGWSQPRNAWKNGASDETVLREMQDWMKGKLPCVAGRREFNRGHYFMNVATRDSVPRLFEQYKMAIRSEGAVACLFIFNDPNYYHGRADVAQTFAFLAQQMQPISSLPAHELAAGAPLTNTIELECPVTGLVTSFDDFECIAFCPQSNDIEDPLYDPLMAMPYPCVNLSSDVFAFSRFVADAVLKVCGQPAYQEDDLGRLESVLDTCVDRWQRVATATIDKYQSLTDTSLCPVHVTADSQYWIAGHKDPAFAEAIKEEHSHELPVLYARRIVDNWLDHFRGNSDYSASGMARDGLPV